MHAFMPSILVGPAGLDEFREDPEADPPRRELRETREGRGGKRHAVVRADAGGQAIFLKQSRKDGLRLGDGGGAQGLAAQEIPTEAIGHGERIAVAAVAGPELPLVVGTPDIVGGENLARRLARMADATALASSRYHAVAAQDVAGGGAPGEEPSRMAPVQQRQEFLAPPGGMPAPGLEDRRHDRLRRLIRRATRAARALLEPGCALAQIALDPLVPGLARHPVVVAQLRDRPATPKMLANELRPLVHG